MNNFERELEREAFLPSEEDEKPYNWQEKQKLKPLNKKEQKELDILVASEKEREQDLLTFGYAADNLAALLAWPEDQILKLSVKEKIKYKKSIMDALNRSLDILRNSLMEVREKEKKNDILERIQKAIKNPGFAQLIRFAGNKDLEFLLNLFNNKYNKLLKEKKRQADLGLRTTGEYEKIYPENDSVGKFFNAVKKKR